MERDASAANPPSEDRGDDVNPNPGDGASGPGDFSYDQDSQVGDVGGEATIDLEDKARRMAEGDASADPASGADSDSAPNDDDVSGNPEIQTGG